MIKNNLNDKKVYFYCESENLFFFVEIINDEKIFINGNNFTKKLTSFENTFFLLLFQNYPNCFDDSYFYKILYKSTLNPSKEKNYFVNKMDYLFQLEIGLNPKTIAKFKSTDRVLLTFTRSIAIHIKEEIKIDKFNHNDSLGQFYLNRKLYQIGNSNYNKLKIRNDNVKPNNSILEKYLSIYIQFMEINVKSELTLQLIIIKEFITKIYETIEYLDGLKNSALSERFRAKILEEDFIFLSEKIEKLFNSKPSIVNKITLQLNDISKKLGEIKLKSNNLRKEFLNGSFDLLLREIDKLSNSDDLINSEEKIEERFLKKFSKVSNGIIFNSPDWHDLLKIPFEVVEIEKHAEKIWVITPDFFFDEIQVLNKNFADVIANNLKLNKEIKYLYPPESKHLSRWLEMKYKDVNPSNKTSFHEVSNLSKFFKFFDHEIILYDPHNKDSAYHCGFYLDFFKEKNANSTLDPTSLVHIRIPDKTMVKLIKFMSSYIYSNHGSTK